MRPVGKGDVFAFAWAGGVIHGGCSVRAGF